MTLMANAFLNCSVHEVALPVQNMMQEQSTRAFLEFCFCSNMKKPSKAEANKKIKLEKRKEELDVAIKNAENLKEVMSAAEAIRETLMEE